MIGLEQIRVRRSSFTLRVEELQIYPGLTLLAGRNGAGKSTLLHLLATAVIPDHGVIRYGSRTIDDALPLIRSQIGFVPTGLELYEDMTVKGVLRYFCSLKGRYAPLEVAEILDQLGMAQYRNSKIKQLSQGKKQKVAIAQALLGSPYLLLLDEPLNYLDSRERKMMVALLTRYARHHVVIVATHELNEWDEQMDRLLWLEDGDILFHGTPQAWTAGLERGVWVGIVHAQEVCKLPEQDIIHIRQMECGRMQVRMLSATEIPGFTSVDITAEDAYFIRRSLSQNL